MENGNRQRFKSERHDRFWTGLALVIVGGVLLIDKMGVDLPHWVFTWPMILILAGIISGLKCGFKNFSWLIMVGVGVFFLADEIIIDINAKRYLWPVLIIGAGLLFILRPKKKWYRESDKQPPGFSNGFSQTNVAPTSGFEPEPVPGEDIIDSVSIFGGVKKVITSKNFRGGEIVCFMGGAEYNLSQADITGPIEIEVVQAFGGTKLIVPPHWEIRS